MKNNNINKLGFIELKNNEMELFSFIRNPKSLIQIHNYKFYDIIKLLLNLYLIYYILSFASIFLGSLIIYILNLFLRSELSFLDIIFQINPTKVIYNKYLDFWLVVLIGPFIEEVIFRLHLNFKKNFIKFHIIVLFYIFINQGKIWTTNYIIIILIILFTFVIYKFSDRFINYNLLKIKFYNYVVYFSVLVFGLMHILNIEIFNYKYTFLYVIGVFPQIILGFILSYIRIKTNFKYCIIFHSMANFIPAFSFI